MKNIKIPKYTKFLDGVLCPDGTWSIIDPYNNDVVASGLTGKWVNSKEMFSILESRYGKDVATVSRFYKKNQFSS